MLYSYTFFSLSFILETVLYILYHCCCCACVLCHPIIDIHSERVMVRQPKSWLDQTFKFSIFSNKVEEPIAPATNKSKNHVIWSSVYSVSFDYTILYNYYFLFLSFIILIPTILISTVLVDFFFFRADSISSGARRYMPINLYVGYIYSAQSRFSTFRLGIQITTRIK